MPSLSQRKNIKPEAAIRIRAAAKRIARALARQDAMAHYASREESTQVAQK